MSTASIALTPAPGVAPASSALRVGRGPRRHAHVSEPASRWVDWLRPGGRLIDRDGRRMSIAGLFGAVGDFIQLGQDPEIAIGRSTGARV